MSDRQGACRADVHSLTFLFYRNNSGCLCFSGKSRRDTANWKTIYGPCHMWDNRALLPPYLLCSDTKPATRKCYSSTNNSKSNLTKYHIEGGIFRTPSHPVSSFLIPVRLFIIFVHPTNCMYVHCINCLWALWRPKMYTSPVYSSVLIWVFHIKKVSQCLQHYLSLVLNNCSKFCVTNNRKVECTLKVFCWISPAVYVKNNF